MEKSASKDWTELQCQHDYLSVFRAVSTRAGRKGIKLEEAFWQTLVEIARENGKTIGELVGEIADNFQDSKNLTSVLRVKCMTWLLERNSSLQSLTSPQNLLSMISACPTPALALNATRRIVASNPSFVAHVTRGLGVPAHPEIITNLKILMDVQVSELLEQLQRENNRSKQINIRFRHEYHVYEACLNVISLANGIEAYLVGYLEH